MLVKIQHDVLNMTIIESVLIMEQPKMVIKKGRFFDSKVEEGCTYSIVVSYKDIHDRPSKFTLHSIITFQDAAKIRDEILEQAKELDANQATQLLENALREH